MADRENFSAVAVSYLLFPLFFIFPDGPWEDCIDRYPEPKLRFISGTIFTRGFNSVTRGHAVEPMDGGSDAKKSTGMFCRMNGCEEESYEWAIPSPYSGTLSYIFSNFNGTQSFSDVVAEAKEVGFTEPGQEGHYPCKRIMLELSDIQIANLVPKPLRDITSTEEFMHRLPNFDVDLSKQRDEAEAAGEVLRFVGVVDVAEVKGLVELRRYSNYHPFT